MNPLSRLWASYWRAVRSPPDLEVSDQLREFVRGPDELSSLRANARPPDKVPDALVDMALDAALGWLMGAYFSAWLMNDRWNALVGWERAVAIICTVAMLVWSIGKFVAAFRYRRNIASRLVGEVGSEAEQTTEPNTTFTRRSSRGEGLEAGRKDGETDGPR